MRAVPPGHHVYPPGALVGPIATRLHVPLLAASQAGPNSPMVTLAWRGATYSPRILATWTVARNKLGITRN